MRFAILGSGAVGGYYGARLARAGHDVTFIARGAHLRPSANAACSSGRRSATSSPAPPPTTRPPCRADVVVVAVKTYDNETASRPCLR